MIKINIDIPYTNITNYLVVFGNMEDDLNDLYNIPIPTNNTKTVAHNKQMIDLGIVFKAETILETIEQYKKSIE